MSWRDQKIFAIVALAAAFVINSLPAPPEGNAVTQRGTGPIALASP
jgi:hypothetical protein